MGKNLVNFALAAFILSGSLPVAGYAAGQEEEHPLPKEEECAALNESTPDAQNESGAIAMQDSSPSSYQGTTTGPGPNGGYPGSPRGSYNVVNPPKQNSR